MKTQTKTMYAVITKREKIRNIHFAKSLAEREILGTPLALTYKIKKVKVTIEDGEN